MEFSQSSKKLKSKHLISENLKTPVLINQGTYGCVYYPNIKCDRYVDGETTLDSDLTYISKVQYNNTTTQNEISISNEIKKIPFYNFYFAIIENVCESSIEKEMEKISTNNCKIIKEENTKLVSFSIRYIKENIIILNYLNKLNNKLFFYKKYISTFFYLYNSIDKLIEKNIVHYDLKLNNIMYDFTIYNPIIIDFGLSLNILKIQENFIKNPKSLINYFYTIENYSLWCFEIFALSEISYILNNQKTKIDDDKQILTSEIIENICSIFENNLKMEINKLIEIEMLSDEEILLNTKNNNIFLSQSQFLNKSFNDVVIELLKPIYFQTWDKYSLVLNYYGILLSHPHTLPENLEKYKNKFKKILLSRPDERFDTISNEIKNPASPHII
jgi:serine/threonine protein kinase